MGTITHWVQQSPSDYKLQESIVSNEENHQRSTLTKYNKKGKLLYSTFFFIKVTERLREHPRASRQ